MSRDRNALLLKRASELRWPRRHVAGLAELLRRPKSTAASWLSGRRHMDAATMTLFSEMLRDQGQILVGIAGELAEAAKLKQAQPRRPRGFQIVKDWDGTGVMSDRRWRGGRRRMRLDAEAASC